MSSQRESALKQMVERDLDVWNEQDIAAVDDLYAADVSYHDAMGEVRDRESLKEYMRMIWTAFPDFHIDSDEMIEEGDTVVTRYTFGGTMDGPFRGFEANGESFEMHGLASYRFEDGMVVESWNGTNSLAMIQQLGLLG